MDTCNWLEADSDDENEVFVPNVEDSEYSDEEPESTNNHDNTSNDDGSDCDLSNDENCDINRNIKNTDSINQDYYLSKNKLIYWSRKPPGPSKTKKKNIVIHLPGVKGIAKNCKTPLDCWEYYFSACTIDEIVSFTNLKLSKLKPTDVRERDCSPTDVVEIKALIGLLYLAGVCKMSHVNAKDLWSTDGTAPKLFRCVMSYKRFYLLLRALRFDNVDSRKDRAKTDKLAPIRQIWDNFNLKCRQAYVPSEYCTIDEMMSGFRGRCSFKQYIPSKPNKYGLKSFALSDARTFYTMNLELYAGKQRAGPYEVENKPASIVKRIAQPILNTGRNITMDNWFVSISLVKELVQKYTTTVVGTVRKNKADLPPEFTIAKKRIVNSSMFGFCDELSLVSYIPKKNKCVLMVSSMHQNTEIDLETGDKRKPEIITFYNKTKSGVDMADKLKAAYSVARTSCRWPLTAFFTLLDVAGINSSVIHYCNTCNENPKKLKRSSFLKMLGKDLIAPCLSRRLAVPSLPYDLRTSIERLHGINNPKKRCDDDGEDDTNKKEEGRCYICPRKKNRKSSSKCIRCKLFLCTSHTVKICVKCNSTSMSSDEDY